MYAHNPRIAKKRVNVKFVKTCQLLLSGRWQAPAAVMLARGPEGPEVQLKVRARGPGGPEGEYK